MQEDLDSILPERSWFRDFIKCYPTAESPLSFILFAGMSVMGGILGRSVWLEDDFNHSYPMLNILCLGPSGAGKSQSVKIARNLLNYVPEQRRPMIIEGGATKEKLHEELSIRPHAIVLCPELAAFFSKETYKVGLVPYVTELLDYKDRVEVHTRKDGEGLVIERPEVSFIGGSTREWLQKMLPDEAVGGGFLPRFLPIYEQSRGQKVVLSGRKLKQPEFRWVEPFRQKTFGRFQKIMSKYMKPMEFDLDAEGHDVLMSWYFGLKPINGLLAPFTARAKEQVLRMSLLLAVSCEDRELTAEHFRSAIKLYQMSERRLGEIVTPTTATGHLLALVLECIPEQGIHEVEMFKALRHMYSSLEVTRALQSLYASRDARNEERVWFRT